MNYNILNSLTEQQKKNIAGKLLKQAREKFMGSVITKTPEDERKCLKWYECLLETPSFIFIYFHLGRGLQSTHSVCIRKDEV